MFVAEGVRLLEEAVRFEFHPHLVVYADSLLSDRAGLLVREFARRGVRTVDASARQMDQLSETETPQGILGVFAVPERTLSELHVDDLRSVLICEGVSDPGNLGTLIRSALAFGFDLVAVTGRSAEPYSPKVVRSSAGAVFGIVIIECELGQLVEFAKRRHIAILAADPRGRVRAAEVQELTARGGIALAVGSEPDGLSQTLLEHATARVGIAHTAKVESLNAAVAGSILMNEIYNLHNRVRHAD